MHGGKRVMLLMGWHHKSKYLDCGDGGEEEREFSQ